MIYTTAYQSPLAPMIIKADDEALLSLAFGSTEEKDQSPILDQVKRELDEYWDGKRTVFSVPLNAVGTPFQQKVWQEIGRAHV